MAFGLTPEVEALVIPGPPTAARPRLWVSSPLLQVLSPPAEAGTIEARSVGSFPWLWSDDENWSFDKADGSLLALGLTIPEVNDESGSDHAVWNAAPSTTGTLRLSALTHFGRPPAMQRWFDPAGTQLFAFYAAAIPESSTAVHRRRIAIAENTHLLVADSTLVGWSLTDPTRYLTGPDVPSHVSGTDPDPRLPALLAEFFHIVTGDNVDLLDDGDQGVKRALEDLARRLTAVGDDGDDGGDGEPRAVEVRSKVRQVLEDFT